MRTWASVRRVLSSLLVLAVCAAVAGCDQGSEPAAEPEVTGTELTVMSFNVWYGGASIDPGQIEAAIRETGADVVGVQEPEGNLRRIAEAAGLPFVDESLHLISRFPLFAAEFGGERFAYVAVDPGHVVAIANMHLLCCPYGPNLAAAGKPADDVLALERRTRLPEIEPYAETLGKLADEGVPTFLTGDFNSPSHLDWTEEAVAARDLAYPLEWPASKALADAGFRDSYRDAHPDPAADPGLTWTAGQPPPRMRPSETNDRIDWVMAAGPSETLDSHLVGEDGGPDVEVGVTPWGSDHRAVASRFEVEPAPAPFLVAADPRVVERGERVTLRYMLAEGGPGREAGILAGAEGTPEGKPLQTIPIFDASDHIAPMFGTAPLAPGAYRAALLDRGGETLATSPFWVAEPGSEPRVSTAKASYAPGEPVRVRWQDAPANKLDWVGIFPAGDPSVYGYTGFLYTGARPSGSIEFSAADTGRLAPGRYLARLMLDDGYSVLAEAPFEGPAAYHDRCQSRPAPARRPAPVHRPRPPRPPRPLRLTPPPRSACAARPGSGRRPSRRRHARRSRGRVAAGGVAARAGALLGQLADVPVLAVDLVPEVDRVAGVEALGGDRLGLEEPLAGDRRAAGAAGPQGVQHHVVGVQRDERVREEDEVVDRGEVLGLEAGDRRPAP